MAIIDLLGEADGPLTSRQLAARLGVHHTAVRQHAEVLIDAGLVVAATLPPAGRGRPQVGYRLAVRPDPYQHLSGLLSEAVRTGDTAREVGRRHGAEVTPSPDGPVETLRVEAERLGFRPLVVEGAAGRTELVLEECPFADVASTDPKTICALHRGLAEGVAEAVGGVEVESLHVADPHAGGCRLVLHVRGESPPTT